MKIQISKATFERMEALGKGLTDDVILKAIELTQENGELDPNPNPLRDIFNRLEFTTPNSESTINGNLASNLIFKRYNTYRVSWRGILGEIIGMSSRGINDKNKISEIFGVRFEDEENDDKIYIKELNTSTRSPSATQVGRIIARGSKSLAYSVYVKFKRLPRNVDYRTLGEYREFKININGKDCEIS